jgi:hypothetical protein
LLWALTKKSDYSDDAVLSGLDLSQSTGQITLSCQFVNAAPAQEYTVLFAVQHTRILSLSTEVVKIMM